MAQVSRQKLRRKAILIKGFSEDQQEIEDDEQYIEYYKSFFYNNAGGAYEENEIEIFEDISANELKSYFASNILDYVVVVFLGHGATQDDYQLFKLNETEIIKPGQIEINSNKQLIILESCRSISPSKIHTIELSDKNPTYKEGGKFYYPICRQSARTSYDDQIEQCNDGQVIFFACSKGETAKDFYFSRCLIQYAFNWHLDWRNCRKTLKITELDNKIPICVNHLAMEYAHEAQNPQIIGNIAFPFAVNKF